MLRCYHPGKRGKGLALGLGIGTGVLAFSLAVMAQEPDAPDADSSQDLTETIPSESGDIVENIATGEVTSDASPLEQDDAASQDASNDRTQISGYARQSLELVYPELSRRGRDVGPPLLWRDAFISHSQLVLRGSYLKGRFFEATLSGMLGYTLHAAREAPIYSRPGTVDLARGELDPQLREAYVGFYWPSVDLRIGQQRVAWGRADFQSPNDVINARDLRNPLLGENELRYLPTPVVRASVTAGVFTVEAVVSPLFVPDRFDPYGSNWSPIQRETFPPYQQFLGQASLIPEPSVEREFARLWQHTERPSDNGKGLSGGARVSAALPGIDLNAYYHYGYDGSPYVRIDPAFAAYLTDGGAFDPQREVRFMPGNFVQLEPVLQQLQDGLVGPDPISARYIRRHHAGFDLATLVGPVAVRLDAAYESRRVFYKVDLNGFASPAVLGVAGLEYQTGTLDDIALLEFIAVRLLRKPDPLLPLLAYEQTSTGLAGTLRWSLGDSWGLDLRGLVGLNPQTYALMPALRYKPSDAFSLRVGALLMSGERGSLGWYYGDNDTAFVQVRYGF